jgi:hypothetical protein
MVLDDFGGRLGRAWRESDEERTDRAAVVQSLLEGRYSDRCGSWPSIPVNPSLSARCWTQTGAAPPHINASAESKPGSPNTLEVSVTSDALSLADCLASGTFDLMTVRGPGSQSDSIRRPMSSWRTPDGPNRTSAVRYQRYLTPADWLRSHSLK